MHVGGNTMNDFLSITENYHERMQRILLFEPLYRLDKKMLKTKAGDMVSCMGVGLLTLLFFFEHMISHHRKKSGVKELANFLREMCGEHLELDTAGFEKLARDIVQVYRPATGQRSEKTFFNWHTQEADRVQYSILKAYKADIAANEQYYTLDEQGLELIFATKEYFSEFQLSINQLVLRKQLEKGEFALALRQIEEMRLDVYTLRERIVRIGNEIHRNIISEATFEHYKTMVEDIKLRLNREHEEFEELEKFTREVHQSFSDNVVKPPERTAYENIIEVEKNLNEVHGEHRKLLKVSIELSTTALSAAEESLYFSGVDLFNFEQEITNRVFAAPLPLSSTRTLVKPFLQLEQCKVWSPLTVFAQQRLERDDTESTQSAFPDFSNQIAEESKQLANLQQNYVKIMQIVREVLQDKENISLAEVVAYMQHQAQRELLQAKQFYLFWILLHRKSPFICDLEQVGEKSAFYEIVKTMPKIKKIIVEKKQNVLQINEEFAISDMEVRLELN